MPKHEFGFVCGQLSLALTAEKFVIPGSKTKPLRLSLVPVKNANDAAGPYTMRVTSAGVIVCDLPVHLMWVTHKAEPEPFLAIKAQDPEELRTALDAYAGKPVELKFTPRH